jgi:hypothetical protein
MKTLAEYLTEELRSIQQELDTLKHAIIEAALVKNPKRVDELVDYYHEWKGEKNKLTRDLVRHTHVDDVIAAKEYVDLKEVEHTYYTIQLSAEDAKRLNEAFNVNCFEKRSVD